MDTLLNTIFTTYSCSGQLLFTDDQLDYLKESIAKIAFDSYISSTGDIIPLYRDYRQVYSDMEIRIKRITQNGLKLTFLTIKSALFLNKLFIFLNSRKSIILLRRTNQLDDDILDLFINLPSLALPLIITRKELHIESIISDLYLKTSHYGDFRLLYNHGHKDINANLKKIKLIIPESDLISLNKENKNNILNGINSFLLKTTKINFTNLTIMEFSSTLININHEGRLRINGEKLGYGDERLELIWLIVEAISS